MFVLYSLIMLYLSKRKIYSIEFFNNLAKHCLDSVLKKRFHVFIFREREREGEGEGEKH